MSVPKDTKLTCSYRGNTLVVTQLFSNAIRCGDIDVHHAAVADLHLNKRSIKKYFKKHFNSIKDIIGFMCRWTVDYINNCRNIFTQFRKRLARLRKRGSPTSRDAPIAGDLPCGTTRTLPLPAPRKPSHKPGIFSAVPPPLLEDAHLVIQIRNILLKDRALHGVYEFFKDVSDKRRLVAVIAECLMAESTIETEESIARALSKVELPPLNLEIWEIFLTEKQQKIFDKITNISVSLFTATRTHNQDRALKDLQESGKMLTREHEDFLADRISARTVRAPGLDQELLSPIGRVVIGFFITTWSFFLASFKFFSGKRQITDQPWWPIVHHLNLTDWTDICQMSLFYFNEPLSTEELRGILRKTVKKKRNSTHYQDFVALRNKMHRERQ